MESELLFINSTDYLNRETVEGKMKVLITGSNGFIAQSIIESEWFRDQELYGLDLGENRTSGLVKYYQIDISKPFAIEETFDVIIHLAALNRTHVDTDYAYDIFQKINVDGAKHVARSCSYHKFIFLSTTTVYGRETDEVDELSALHPMGDYAISKASAEKELQGIIPDEKLVILRTVNVIGAKQKKIALIPIFFEKTMNNEPITIFVPKKRTMQLLDVSDLIYAFHQVIEVDAHGIFNLATKDYYSLEEVAQKIVEITRSSSEIRIENHDVERRVIIHADKARNELHWEPSKTIPEVLCSYFKMVKRDGDSNS